MTSQKITRRQFLKQAGLTLGAMAIACSGLGYVATRTPALNTPELTYQKETTMNKTILITYATRASSTAEIAAAIGETLAARGFRAEIKPVKSNPSLAGYDAVILGSAIRMGNWLPEMVDFIKNNQQTLAKMPVSLFSVHMLHIEDDEASQAMRLDYLKAIRPFLPPANVAFFAGKMDLAALSFVDRLIAKMVKASNADLRDWSKIRTWANEMPL